MWRDTPLLNLTSSTVDHAIQTRRLLLIYSFHTDTYESRKALVLFLNILKEFEQLMKQQIVFFAVLDLRSHTVDNFKQTCFTLFKHGKIVETFADSVDLRILRNSIVQHANINVKSHTRIKSKL
jgi:hypothetical protein